MIILKNLADMDFHASCFVKVIRIIKRNRDFGWHVQTFFQLSKYYMDNGYLINALRNEIICFSAYTQA